MKLFSGIAVVVILFSLSASTCSKEDESFKFTGSIIGIDARKCACFGNLNCGCCGFWQIAIEEKTYIFKKLPPEPKLDLQNAKFPINVSLDYHPDPDSCAQSWGYIIIDRFKIN